MRFDEYRAELRRDPEYVAAERELRAILALADDILFLRLERGWSQTELARRVGTDQANISRVEAGLANPTVAFLKKIAAAFDAEVDIRLRRPDDLPSVVTETGEARSTATEQTIWFGAWPRGQELGIAVDSPSSGSTMVKQVSS